MCLANSAVSCPYYIVLHHYIDARMYIRTTTYRRYEETIMSPHPVF